MPNSSFVPVIEQLRVCECAWSASGEIRAVEEDEGEDKTMIGSMCLRSI
jgi:hypothetical protein